jgi:hypothetical protein
MGAMLSASTTPSVDMLRSVLAALDGVGDTGKTDGGGKGSRRARLAALAASACLFGGPRRFVSRLYVQSTPRSRHGLQGISVSSHLTLRMLHMSQARLNLVSFGLIVGSRIEPFCIEPFSEDPTLGVVPSGRCWLVENSLGSCWCSW